MDIRDYVRALRTGWLLLLVGLLLGGGAGYGLTRYLPREYTAETQLFVTTTGSTDLATAVQGNDYAQQKVASYATLVTSRRLADAVLTELGSAESPTTLMKRISASVVTDTTVLDVSVTDRTAAGALDLARAVDDQFTRLVRDLETPDGQTVSPVRIAVIAEPQLPTGPSSPAVVGDSALGAVLGLLLAVVVAVVRDRMDTTVKDDDVARQTGSAPVIGRVPEDAALAKGRISQPHAGGPMAEAIRQVRTNLSFLDVDRPPRSFMVTSALPGEGKTTLALSLAIALAEAGNSVALVEADLRRPRVSAALGLVDGVGLTTVLKRDAELAEVVQPRCDGRLHVLAAGPQPPNPSELLASEAMAAVMARLTREHDIVVVDAPPVLPVADATALAGLVDGVVLCLRWGAVPAHQLRRAVDDLERVGARVLGLVLSRVPARSVPTSYGYVTSAGKPSLRGRLGRRRGAASPEPLPAVRPRRVTGSRVPPEPVPTSGRKVPGTLGRDDAGVASLRTAEWRSS